jgi:hypothetical protein
MNTQSWHRLSGQFPRFYKCRSAEVEVRLAA